MLTHNYWYQRKNFFVPAEAFLTKHLDPGRQAGYDADWDVDNHVQHQLQVGHAHLLMALQILPHGLNLHVEANGAQVVGEDITPKQGWYGPPWWPITPEES